MARELVSEAPMAALMTLCGSVLTVPNRIGVNVFAGIAFLNGTVEGLWLHLMGNLLSTLLRHRLNPPLSLPPDCLPLLAANLVLLYLTMTLPGLTLALAHPEAPPDLLRSPVPR